MQPAAMRVPCRSRSFWEHEYNAPHVFRLASYLTGLCDNSTRPCGLALSPLDLNRSPSPRSVGQRSYPFLSVTCESVSRRGTAPPVSSSPAAVPLGRNLGLLSRRSFLRSRFLIRAADLVDDAALLAPR